MLTDLSKYDLLNLVLFEAMPEESRADMALKFTEALSGYLGDNLNQYFGAGSEEELVVLLNRDGVSPEDVITYYQTKIPNMEKTIEDLCLKFKKDFVIDVYNRQVEKLRAEVSTFAGVPNDDEIRNQVMDSRRLELEDWEKVLNAAAQDDWDTVSKNLSVVVH